MRVGGRVTSEGNRVTAAGPLTPHTPSRHQGRPASHLHHRGFIVGRQSSPSALDMAAPPALHPGMAKADFDSALARGFGVTSGYN